MHTNPENSVAPSTAESSIVIRDSPLTFAGEPLADADQRQPLAYQILSVITPWLSAEEKDACLQKRQIPPRMLKGLERHARPLPHLYTETVPPRSIEDLVLDIGSTFFRTPELKLLDEARAQYCIFTEDYIEAVVKEDALKKGLLVELAEDKKKFDIATMVSDYRTVLEGRRTFVFRERHLSVYTRAIDMLRRARRDIQDPDKQLEKEARHALDELIKIFSFDTDLRLIECEAARLERARTLVPADGLLALAYLAFNQDFFTRHFVPSYYAASKDEAYHTAPLIVKTHAERNDRLFSDIVALFEAAPEPPAVVRATSVAPPESTPDVRSAHAGPTNQELARAILGTPYQGVYSDEMRLRIGYFAEDAVRRGLGVEQLEALRHAFTRFNLLRRMRDRETAPLDWQIRNWLDDVTLNHINQGAVPSAEDLTRCYEKVFYFD